jgi:hypothetical protein
LLRYEKKPFINKVSFKIVKICTSGLCQIHKCVIVETIGLPVFKFYLLCSVYQQNKAIIIFINPNASFVHPYSNYILYFLIHVHVVPVMLIWYFLVISLAGADPGGVHPARAPLPLKLEKIWFFGVKSWFFTRNTPTIFAPRSAWRNFFKCAPPNLKSGIRPWLVKVKKLGNQMIGHLSSQINILGKILIAFFGV